MSKKEKLSVLRVLIISRPFWWVNTGVPFLVGALLASQSLSLPIAIGFLYFLVPYNLLMYGVNDIFDYESDIKNPRKNGSINGSVLPLSLHRTLWVVMIMANAPFLAYFLYIGNFASSIFLAIMIFMVFAYSQKGLRFKEVPVLDSFTSAFHYASPFVFGILLMESGDLWLPLFASFFAWVAANHAFGAIQDIAPDKEAGISSVATALGSKVTLYFSIGLYLLAAILPVFFYGAVGLFGTLAVLPYLGIVLRCLPDRENDSSKLFSSGWSYFLYCNYIVGAIGSIILVYLYNR